MLYLTQQFPRLAEHSGIRTSAPRIHRISPRSQNAGSDHICKKVPRSMAGDPLGADHPSYGTAGGSTLNHLWTVQGSWPAEAISVVRPHDIVASLRRVSLDLFDSGIPPRNLFTEQLADGTAVTPCALRWTCFPQATCLL